jgi:hypothetical protein
VGNLEGHEGRAVKEGEVTEGAGVGEGVGKRCGAKVKVAIDVGCTVGSAVGACEGHNFLRLMLSWYFTNRASSGGTEEALRNHGRESWSWLISFTPLITNVVSSNAV